MQTLECPGCGKRITCDPTAGDDWGGDEQAVGPECLKCEVEMEPIEESE